MTVRFVINGELIELADIDPNETVLDFIRYRLRRTGTKEGCAEGDCGACTVLVGELAPTHDKIHWRAVNACIQLLPMLHGKAVLTVESLSSDGNLQPLQSRMASNGSTQCGFCTPGFVMSLYARSITGSGSDLPVQDTIAGNLCRCTGYGPILDAAQTDSAVERDDTEVIKALSAIQSLEGAQGRYRQREWFAPKTIEELDELRAAHPDAQMIAGATDVGLWVTKQLRSLDKIIFLSDVQGLDRIETVDGGLSIGATARYADAHYALAGLHPDLGELVRRIGGLQVRNAGTVGGNIANASPIGDGPPAFIALGAQLTLRNVDGRRTMPLEDYFLDYGRQDQRPTEFVESLWIPRPAPEDIIYMSKLSRRFDSDISAVCGAFALKVANGLIIQARVAFGGMAPIPRRATACEEALTGRPFSAETIERAADALRHDYTPLTDLRGSAAYRLDVASNLLWRLWHREQGEPVSVLEVESTHG